MHANRKLSAIKNSIVLLIEKLPYTTARELGKACGRLISTKFVLEDVGRFGRLFSECN